MSNQKFGNVEEYIKTFPINTQMLLQQLRQIIKTIVPQAKEKISYNMPAFYLEKNLIHFAGYKNHIGLYPGVDAIVHFESEIQNYKFAKGSIQFPTTQKLPVSLITKIVKFNVEKLKLKQKA